MKSKITKKDVEYFLKVFDIRDYKEGFYHTIKLPFGMKISGAGLNVISWDVISKFYNFKNKKVADIGCSLGYYCFKIKEQGAKEVKGFDIHKGIIKFAKEVAKLKELDIKFKVFDIEKEDIEENYDIILFLNTSHHLKNPKEAFYKIFKKTKVLIAEIEFNNVSRKELINIAKKNSFKLIKEEEINYPNNFRKGRKTMVFEK